MKGFFMSKESPYDSGAETRKHIMNVQLFLCGVVGEILKRSSSHDKTKLDFFEKQVFDEYTLKLENTTYGSDEYKEFLKEMAPALEHHYEHNRHHPEYFKNGISGMNLVDLIEMLCDWTAATLRHKDGDIFKSIEINQKRFGYSDELKNILFNTVKEIDFKMFA